MHVVSQEYFTFNIRWIFLKNQHIEGQLNLKSYKYIYYEPAFGH